MKNVKFRGKTVGPTDEIVFPPQAKPLVPMITSQTSTGRLINPWLHYPTIQS